MKLSLLRIRANSWSKISAPFCVFLWLNFTLLIANFAPPKADCTDYSAPLCVNQRLIYSFFCAFLWLVFYLFNSLARLPQAGVVNAY